MPISIEVPQKEFKDPRKAIKHVVVFPATYQRPLNIENEVYQLPSSLLTYPKKYPFDLDPFQIASCAAIERNESVLVCAHTSAGKTVIAEYAIALCMKRGQKVVYTSPIKALSNQKFRDMQLEYLKKQEEALQNNSKERIATVGLLTGDTTINKNADILIMTTEILRTLLQNNSDICREIGCVIFDEVHYMKNDERGSVWENTIAMLDTRIPMVFLSATIYNSVEFASWITYITDKIVHAVYTEYRPVPLQFFLMPMQSTQAYRIASSDDRNTIDMENLQRCCQSLPSSNYVTKVVKTQQYDTILNAINFLYPASLPAIIFTLSRQKCTEQAIHISKQLRHNLLTQEERTQINELFNAAIDQLSEEDKELPQILQTQQLLSKGIAVHHSGLIPTIKELIELLFSLDLIKIIFVTETFAMGLNLPAKTVLFTDMTKFDGVQNRSLTSSEFIQMAGRSGRRGKDVQGLVIILVAGQLQAETACKLIQQPAEALNSAYRVQWNQNDINLIKKSFKQFQQTCRLQKIKDQLQIKTELKDSLENQLKQQKIDYKNIMNALSIHKIKSELLVEQQQILSLKDLRQLLILGRVVKVFDNQQSFIGIITNVNTINGQTFYQVLTPTLKQNQQNQQTQQKQQTIQLTFLQNQICPDWTDWAQVANEEINRADKTLQSENIDYIFNQSNQEYKINIDVFSALKGLYTQQFDVLTYIALITLIEQRMSQQINQNAKKFVQLNKKQYFANKQYNYNVFKVHQSAIQCAYDTTIQLQYFQQKTNFTQIINNFMTTLKKQARNLLTKQMLKGDFYNAYMSLYYQILKRIDLSVNVQNQVEKNQYQSLQQQLNKLDTILQQIQVNYQIRNIQQIIDLYQVSSYIYVGDYLLNSSQQMVLSMDYQAKQSVLTQLNYQDKNKVKYTLLTHLDSVNSLILSEIITEGIINNISEAQLCALIASLLQEVQDEQFTIKESESELYTPIQQLKQKVDQINQLCHLNNTDLEFNRHQTEQIVNELGALICYKWATYNQLQDIMSISKQLFEGNVIRLLKRVVNVLQQIEQAAQMTDLIQLQELAQRSLLIVNRGLVKQQSLYVISDEEEQNDQNKNKQE